MLKSDKHKKALEKLDDIIDIEHVDKSEKLQIDLWQGKPVNKMPYIPAIINYPIEDWPIYPFTECWDDIEKNFISALQWAYKGALIKDDRVYTVWPGFGVVNIPELFGIETIITDLGNSMSEGCKDIDRIKKIIDNGIPDLTSGVNKKVEEFEYFAKEELMQYEKLCTSIHLCMPDTQGPLDLAHLIWGGDIFTAFYDYPKLVHQLMDIVTETYIQYTMRHKKIINEPLNYGYHIVGVKLVNGGVRICDDVATLVSKQIYKEFIMPYNIRAYKPFDGGWLHYCGNGNHLIDEMLNIEGVHALHMGNPDNFDLCEILKKTSSKNIVLYWSGSTERIKEILQDDNIRGLCMLTENRYASKSVNEARNNLNTIRNGGIISKSAY